ncbi:hypothetical protein M2280_006302 [Prescottella agglutinans]|uniref:Uncharacterized protein n=1 Tax=Prescottella agglutinans TaxID=1644129 RepID=A0ABT6ML44_9NOCA|nr:hypothetical protein [Prescottella agglutinans]
MGRSIVRVKRSPKPPRADVVFPVCASPKRYPCKLDEKKRKMVPLWKIHAERESLQQRWLRDRRERVDARHSKGDSGFRRY